MAENNSVVLLRKTIEGDDFVDACNEEDATVICVNRETKNRKLMSFRILYQNNKKFWLQNEVWEYFLSGEVLQKIRERMSPQQPGQGYVAADKPGSAAVQDGYGNEYEAIAAMSDKERVEHIKKSKERLDQLILQKPRQENLVTEALVETARDTIMYNYATIMGVMNLSNDEAKKHTQDLVDSTYDLVKSSTNLISTNLFNDELMNTLVAKSNGTIIQHMTRTHLNGLAFLSYYNSLVSSSSAINKLRINFAKKYRSFYQRLLPDVDEEKITLEKVFHGGMRAIPEADFYNWAVGFLVHDIGKAAAVEYHEGETAYNRDIVIEHVSVGYNSVMNKTNYPRDVGLITGYHHEYYGNQDGYGYFRLYLDQYKKLNPRVKQGFCIAFEFAPMMDCEALAFFPAKVLEIIDVFDSLTDPNRKYRKPLTTDEALAMMQEEFINKYPKLDVIIFDIFSQFIKDISIEH